MATGLLNSTGDSYKQYLPQGVDPNSTMKYKGIADASHPTGDYQDTYDTLAQRQYQDAQSQQGFNGGTPPTGVTPMGTRLDSQPAQNTQPQRMYAGGSQSFNESGGGGMTSGGQNTYAGGGSWNENQGGGMTGGNSQPQGSMWSNAASQYQMNPGQSGNSYGGPSQSTQSNGLTTGVTPGQVQTGYDSGGAIQRNVQTNNLNGLQTGAGYGNIQNSLNTSGVPSLVGGDALGGAMKDAQNAAYNQQQSRLDPQYKQQENDLKNQLVQQGIMQNSDAWNRAMGDFNRNKTDAYQTAYNNSVGLGNAAQAQLYGQGLSSNQNAYSQALNSGQFGNAAQAQGFGQNFNNAQLNNSVNQQQFNQNLQGMQAGNAAQGQQNSQNLNQAQFGNAAQNQVFGQGLQNANMNNQANLQNFNTGMATRQQNFAENNAQLNRDTATQNNNQNGLYGLAGLALQNPGISNGLLNAGGSLINGVQNLFGYGNSQFGDPTDYQSYYNPEQIQQTPMLPEDIPTNDWSLPPMQVYE